MLFLLATLLLSFSSSAKDIVLTENNVVSLSGPVTSQSVTQVMQDLQKLTAKSDSKEPIYLVLNTPGGSILDGLDLVNFIDGLNRPIHTISLFSASMGFQLVQSLGDRYVTQYSTLMSHKASGGFRGEFPGQLDSRYGHILSVLEMMDKKTVERSKGKQTLASYTKLYENEYWATGAKAVSDGFADEVVTVSCDKSLSGEEVKKVTIFIFDLNVRFAKCPMITAPLGLADSSDYFLYDFKGKDPIAEFNRISKEVQKSY